MLSRRRQPVQAEDSAAVRLAACGAVVSAAVGVGWFGGLGVLTVPAVALILAGHRWSWQRRHASRRMVQAIVGLAMGAASCLLVAELFLNVGADPFPQGTFLLLLMGITGFDIRTRANCYSTLLLALAGIYAAASVAYGSAMIAVAVVFAACVLATLALAYRADAESTSLATPRTRATHGSDTQFIHITEPGSAARPDTRGVAPLSSPAPRSSLDITEAQRPRRASTGRAFGLLVVAVVLGGIAAFISIPPYEGTLPVLPVSSDLIANHSFNGQVLTPLVPLVGIGATGGSHSLYYGFSPELQLGAYGAPDNTVVMRVQSTGWSYWRMQTYDEYTGHSWLTSTGYPYELDRDTDGSVQPAVYPANVGASVNATTIRQTYTLIQGGSNLIAAAYRPVKLYFPAPGVWQRAGSGDLLADQPLPAGTTYTVVSRLPSVTPDQLRAAQGSDPWEVRTVDLSLPALSPHIEEVALTAVQGAATRYDDVMKIIAYLQAHAHYDINSPALVPGQEAVTALLQSHRGYCEQFATALTVLARANGIPARLVTGFAAGAYDPFSRVYTVRASDAHAWTEIYFPNRGWVPFDATPSFGAEPQPHAVGGWILGSAVSALPRPDWSGLMESGTLAAGGSGAFVGGAIEAVTHGTWLAGILMAILVAMGAVLIATGIRRRRVGLAGAGPMAVDRRRRDVVAAYAGAEGILRRRGLPAREAGTTPRGHARRLSTLGLDDQSFHVLAEMAMVAAYADEDVTTEDVATARRLQGEIRRTQAPRGTRG